MKYLFKKGHTINNGRKASEETKRNLSISKKGKTPKNFEYLHTSEINQKRSETAKRKGIGKWMKGRISPMKGKKHTKESISKISKAKKGKAGSIGSSGTFTKNELIEHVKQGDAVGKTIVEMEMEFLEAIKSGSLLRDITSAKDDQDDN